MQYKKENSRLKVREGLWLIKITILVDDSVSAKGLCAEHGLSMLIETPEKNMLFDTGQSSLFLQNAQRLGVDVSDIDTIVLSHCHYDHAGGVPDYVKNKTLVNIYAHSNIFRKCCKIENNGHQRNAGLPWTKNSLKENNITYHLNNRPKKISDNIFLTGEIPMVTDYETVAKGFYTYKDNELDPDLFLDDQALIIKTSDGLVIILGCSHRGVINTIEHARRITEESKIHTVIGGMHLIDADEERISKVIEAFNQYNVKNIIPLHCTGFKASAEIYNQMKTNYKYACNKGRVSLVACIHRYIKYRRLIKQVFKMH